MASRTKNSLFNIVAAFCAQFLSQISNFIVRTIFIHVLATEYLGINGLFTNILQVLSLAELGVSGALIYSMYKPMAKKDVDSVRVYMSLYRKIYRVIGCVVLFGGILLTPFLDFFINARPNVPESLELIYILYVIRSASTYFFAYKQSIFQADQKAYVISRNMLIFTLFRSLAEIIVLISFRQFIVYLIVAVIFNYLQNIWIAHLANKNYPYIKEKYKEKADKEVVKELTKNIKAMFMHKVSAVILNSSDNIILSKFVGLVTVGLYSNYSMIIVLVRNCLYMIFDGIVPSVGNLCAVTDDDTRFKVYRIIAYGNMWLSGFCSICMLFILNPFIGVWAGENYLLEKKVVLAIVVSFYIQTNMRAIDMFRSATGLFYNDRYVPIAQCLINIVVSIIFVKIIGVAGIFVGTSVAMLSTVFWVQPCLVYLKIFHKSVIQYFVQYFKYTVIWIIAGIVTYLTLSLVNINGVIGLIYTILCCTIIPNLIFVLFTFRSPEFKSVLYRVRAFSLRRKNG